MAGEGVVRQPSGAMLVSMSAWFVGVANIGCLASWMEREEKPCVPAVPEDETKGALQSQADIASGDSARTVTKDSNAEKPLSGLLGALKWLIVFAAFILIILFVGAKYIASSRSSRGYVDVPKEWFKSLVAQKLIDEDKQEDFA